MKPAAYFILCYRVGSHPVAGFPGSTQRPCSRCESACWLSPASVRLLEEISGGNVQCMECTVGQTVTIYTTEAHLQEHRELVRAKREKYGRN